MAEPAPVPGVRRWLLVAGCLAVAAVACLIVAYLRRHAIADTIAGEGAYFSASGGLPSVTTVYGDNVFAVFRPLNAYLWLGGAFGLALSAFVVAAVAVVSGRRVDLRRGAHARSTA